MASSYFEGTLVSIVVLTFNSQTFITDTLDSIKSQSYGPIELIISDDASDDNTISICEKWLQDNKSRFVATTLLRARKNSGIAPNCNRGWRAAQGCWIKFIAGDDALEPCAIQDFINYACNNEETSVIFSRMQVFKESFSSKNAITVKSSANKWFNNPQSTSQEQFQILLRYNCVNAPTVIIKRSELVAQKGFNEQLPFLEDWPMWLKLTKSGVKMHYLDKITVKYRQHGQSVQQLKNRKRYLSRTELEIDQMFLNEYMVYLPLPERLARKATIFRNRAFCKLFNNRNNYLISFTSFLTGVIPFIILRQYRRRLL